MVDQHAPHYRFPEPSDVQFTERGFPFIPSTPHQTKNGTWYFQTPGIHLISRPDVDLSSAAIYLNGYPPELEFGEYLNDPVTLEPGAKLAKFAAQLCYTSFGPKRSTNARAGEYFTHIKDSGHGSVVGHPTFSILVYGISRSETHEEVRHQHRVYSQKSQRYVDRTRRRFVEGPEYQDDPVLHQHFQESIDRSAAEQDWRAEHIKAAQKAGLRILSASSPTDRRKKVQQGARRSLPNESDTEFVVTGSARAWRQYIEARANEHAETEIRWVAFGIYLCLVVAEPLLFNDYTVIDLPDGTKAVSTPYPKI